jgi:hypothetical protein
MKHKLPTLARSLGGRSSGSALAVVAESQRRDCLSVGDGRLPGRSVGRTHCGPNAPRYFPNETHIFVLITRSRCAGLGCGQILCGASVARLDSELRLYSRFSLGYIFPDSCRWVFQRQCLGCYEGGTLIMWWGALSIGCFGRSTSLSPSRLGSFEWGLFENVRICCVPLHAQYFGDVLLILIGVHGDRRLLCYTAVPACT